NSNYSVLFFSLSLHVFCSCALCGKLSPFSEFPPQSPISHTYGKNILYTCMAYRYRKKNLDCVHFNEMCNFRTENMKKPPKTSAFFGLSKESQKNILRIFLALNFIPT